MLTLSLKKGSYHRKQKMKSFGNHDNYLARIAKSLYYVELPATSCTSLPVTELAAEIFSGANRFSLNRLDIEKAAHLSRNACVSPCSLVLALLYLERLKSCNPNYLTKVSPAELFLISLMVGSKFLQDDGEGEELSNAEWANLTGLSVQEINKAEKQFLDAIDWEVFVSKEEFWNRFSSLESKVGLRQGCKRGWFTYTELSLLIQLIDISTVMQCLWNVTTACLLSYTASVLALVGSALIVSQIPGLSLKPRVSMTDVTQEWTGNTSTSVLSDSLLPGSSGIQDCNVSSSLTLISDSNFTSNEILSLCQPPCNVNDEPTKSDNGCFDLFRKMYLHLSLATFVDIGHLIVDDLNESRNDNSKLIFSKGFNVWALSDYIRNFLVKNSVPGNFYSMASF